MAPRKRRRSIRLPGYDYRSPRYYFVTVCVHGAECWLGDVLDDQMRLNEYGQVAHDFWSEVPAHFPSVSVDKTVVMPNHIHAIIQIQEPSASMWDPCRGRDRRMGAEPCSSGDPCRGGVTPPLQATSGSNLERPALGQIVAYYKYQTSKCINNMRGMPGVRFWQRNYWEHVIRNERTLNHIRAYICTNPLRWQDDQLHPEASPNPFNRGP